MLRNTVRILARKCTSSAKRSSILFKHKGNRLWNVYKETYVSSTDKQLSHPSESVEVKDQTDIEPAAPSYEMTERPRGYCVIIINDKFETMEPLKASGFDYKYLLTTFTELGFIVLVHWNLTAEEMETTMERLSVYDYSRCNALVVCILSHGGADDDEQMGAQRYRIVGVDDETIPIRHILSLFKSSSCKTLVNKPKIFFIDTCLGSSHLDLPPCSDGYPLNSSSLQQKHQDVLTEIGKIQMLKPDEADFFIGYATVFGYVSYKDGSSGSCYIESLTKNLNRYASTLDLQQIMTKVSHDVAERNIIYEGKIRLQVPVTHSTLRKKLFLPPYNLK